MWNMVCNRPVIIFLIIIFLWFVRIFVCLILLASFSLVMKKFLCVWNYVELVLVEICDKYFFPLCSLILLNVLVLIRPLKKRQKNTFILCPCYYPCLKFVRLAQFLVQIFFKILSLDIFQFLKIIYTLFHPKTVRKILIAYLILCINPDEGLGGSPHNFFKRNEDNFL